MSPTDRCLVETIDVLFILRRKPFIFLTNCPNYVCVTSPPQPPPRERTLTGTAFTRPTNNRGEQYNQRATNIIAYNAFVSALIVLQD